MRRVDGLAPQFLALSLDAGCALLLGTARGVRGVGLVPRAPRGVHPSAFVIAVRAHLIGALFRDAARDGATLLLAFEGPMGSVTLACVFDGHSGAFVLCDDEDRVLASVGPTAPEPGGRFTPPPPFRELALADTLSGLEAAGLALLAARAAAETDAHRRSLLRAVSRAADKARRRLAAIDEDLRGADEADVLRRHASLLLAAAHDTPRDATELQILDESETPPRRHVHALPAKPGGETGPRAAVAAAERLFAHARKRETAARIGAERREDTMRARDALALLVTRVAEAGDQDALRALADAGHSLGVPGARASVDAPPPTLGGPRRVPAAPRLPFRRFVSADGRPLLVGRGARDNDALTLHYARPNDLWLHARGVPGAHVVIPLARGESAPGPLLLDAATLAAHFSDARGETIVDVQHAERRHVRKPRGAAPGAVVVERERVVVLRLEPERLARLLRSETLAEGDARSLRAPPQGVRPRTRPRHK